MIEYLYIYECNSMYEKKINQNNLRADKFYTNIYLLANVNFELTRYSYFTI